MREIKFRAWDNENKTMAYSDDDKQEYGWFTDNDGCMICEHTELEKALNNIMQFTGLKDKNDKEIYEGDIVIVNRYDLLSTSWNSEIENEEKILIMSRVGYVVYDEFRLSFRVKSPTGNQTISLSGVGYFDYDIEVIGNIHDNPELLRGEE